MTTTDDKEPNGYELQRSITDLRRVMGEGFSDIKVVLAGLVSRDLFDAELRRMQDKHMALEKDIAELKAQHEAHLAKTRWFVAAVIVPLLTCLIGVGVLYVR